MAATVPDSPATATATAGLGDALCVKTVDDAAFAPGVPLQNCEGFTDPVVEPQTGHADPGLFFAKSGEASDKMVLAHWFPPYPISINNAATRDESTYAKAYLSATGENSKWAPYGRFLTTAPLFRPQRAGDWRLEDAKDDIRTAQAHGLDGFVFDLLGSFNTGDRNWTGPLTLAKAADELGTGFKVIPMIDKNGSTGLGSAAGAAKAVAVFAARPSAYYVDGRFVISSFKGEGKGTAEDVQWWRDVLRLLKSEHHIEASWIGGFLNFGKAEMFRDLTIGEGSWGGGDDPVTISKSGNQVQATHNRGKLAMSPVGTSAVRRTQKVFDESANTEATRAYWEKVIREDPDLVQMVTWNDYSEGNTYQPSEATGYGPLILASWYIEKYKHGKFPKILKDELILTNRNQFVGSHWSGSQSVPVQQWDRGQSHTSPRDTVEVLTFLTAPATVRVTVGGKETSYGAPAGMYAKTFPLAAGSVSARTDRGLGVTSPVTVSARPVQQDLSYYWAVAGRGTAGQRDSMTP